jgi:ubiquinone/menaquinone biosynthesis C-methylase UbiE
MALDPVTAHFDSVAADYDEVLPFFSSFARRFIDVVPLPAGARVLDVGAGRGAITALALANGCAVTAVDSAPRMIELLRRDHPDVHAHVMEAGRLDLPDESFDVVVAGFVIHVVPDMAAAVREVMRVLTPGGLFAFSLPGRADGQPEPRADPANELVKEYRRFHPDGSGRHGNDDDEEQVVPECGFEDLTATTVEVAIPVADGDTYWRWMASHGAGTFIKGLPPGKRSELHARLIDVVGAGTTLHRSATVWQARKPV